jgi:trehalose synthase
VISQRFGVPASSRSARVLEGARRRATDELAGRTVWCAAALPDGRGAATRLHERLRQAEDMDYAVQPLQAVLAEPVTTLAEHLQAMLSGAASMESHLGRADGAVYDEAARGSDDIVGGRVRADDVVVLHDALTAALAQALRERGAHVVWRVDIRPVTGGAGADDAWRFLREHTAGVDAYVVSDGRRISAVLPSPDVLDTKDLAGGDWFGDIAWSSLLADVVHADHGELVGGTRGARPAVAMR